MKTLSWALDAGPSMPNDKVALAEDNTEPVSESKRYCSGGERYSGLGR